MKSLGCMAYRFSLCWSRIIPKGGRDDPINQAGIDHYAKFIDDLIDAGIAPYITLFHWDLPDELDIRYGGLLNRQEFPLDFENYACTCFRAFPKVKHWITFNEPLCSSLLGYGIGIFAPGRTSNREQSSVGDSTTEPWIVGHNLLVAHGRAVKAFRDGFKASSNGEIAVTLNGDYTYPWDPTDPADIEAAIRKLEFNISWYADPIYFGDYPASMRTQLGDRLPTFTEDERAFVHGSNDFYGMNHYTANYIKHRTSDPEPDDFMGNVETLFYNKNNDCIGEETGSPWLRPCAPGFRDLLIWLSKRYSYPKILILESGTSIKGESQISKEDALDDELRVRYYDEYVKAMAQASTLDGVNIRGYFAWSLLDNFEWADGYDTRFGVCYVDYKNGLRREPKKSAKSLKPLFDGLMRKEAIPLKPHSL